MEYKLNCAQLRQMAPRFHAGDRVLLSGRVYTSRDAAHKRIVAAMDAGEPLPYDLQDAVIYYAGPTPAPEGLAVGACGPTTSSRMDPYAPRLLDAGVVAMVGKGERNAAVCDAIVRNKAVLPVTVAIYLIVDRLRCFLPFSSGWTARRMAASTLFSMRLT